MNQQPQARSANPQIISPADQIRPPANKSQSGAKKTAAPSPTPRRSHRKWERYDALTREYWAIVGRE